MMILMKMLALRVAQAIVDWAEPPEPGGEVIARVILAVGRQPIAMRGTREQIDIAARDIARQTQCTVMVLEPLNSVPVPDHGELDRN